MVEEDGGSYTSSKARIDSAVAGNSYCITYCQRCDCTTYCHRCECTIVAIETIARLSRQYGGWLGWGEVKGQGLLHFYSTGLLLSPWPNEVDGAATVQLRQFWEMVDHGEQCYGPMPEAYHWVATISALMHRDSVSSIDNVISMVIEVARADIIPL